MRWQYVIPLLICVIPMQPEGHAQSAKPTFAVATVKPSTAQSWRLQPTVNGYTAMGVSLLQLVQEAYGMYEAGRISGGPKWMDAGKFDLEARVDEQDAAAYRGMALDQKRAMLQILLADRFKLVVRHENREWPVYALVVAKDGPKLVTTANGSAREAMEDVSGLVTRSRPGAISVENFSMDALANVLSTNADVGRIVVNRTGLAGRYSFSLQWTPDGKTNSDAVESAPSIFTAVRQLGLKMEPSQAMIDTVLIVSVEKPSAN